MSRPFVEPEAAALDYCADCQSYFWRDRGHDCPTSSNTGDRIVIALLVATIVVLALLVFGAWRPGWPRG